MVLQIIGDFSLAGIIAVIVGLIILWIIVSIPVYLAGKIVTGGKSSLGDAMVATLFGPIIYGLTLFLVDFFLGGLLGAGSYLIALILAFVAWVWVYKASFKTGWLSALTISILAVLIFAVISILFGALFGLMFPTPFFPTL